MPNTPKDIKLVPTSKVRFSTILPRREYDTNTIKVIEEDGIQQPLIVRPLPTDPNLYEIIDGHMRFMIFHPFKDDSVLVDVRHDVKDSDVFKLSQKTFVRKGRTTQERAEFFARWVETVARERGKDGAQAMVARQARLTEGGLSQYLAIQRTLEKLKGLEGSAVIDFNALKNQSVNKLYELSKLTRQPPELFRVAEHLAQHPNISVHELRRMVAGMRKSTLQLLKEETLSLEKDDSNRVDHARIAKLAQEILGLAEENRKGLEQFNKRVISLPEKFSRFEILKGLERLRRRLQRFQKDIEKLPERIESLVHQIRLMRSTALKIIKSFARQRLEKHLKFPAHSSPSYPLKDSMINTVAADSQTPIFRSLKHVKF